MLTWPGIFLMIMARNRGQFVVPDFDNGYSVAASRRTFVFDFSIGTVILQCRNCGQTLRLPSCYRLTSKAPLVLRGGVATNITKAKSSSNVMRLTRSNSSRQLTKLTQLTKLRNQLKRQHPAKRLKRKQLEPQNQMFIGMLRFKANFNVEHEIASILAVCPVLRRTDFDPMVRQQLHAFHGLGGAPQVREALEEVRVVIIGRLRETVKSWPAYLYKLLKNAFLKAKAARYEKAGAKRLENHKRSGS